MTWMASISSENSTSAVIPDSDNQSGWIIALEQLRPDGTESFTDVFKDVHLSVRKKIHLTFSEQNYFWLINKNLKPTIL